MKKRLISMLLMVCLVLQVCGTSISAAFVTGTTPEDAIKDTLQDFQGVVFEREIVSADESLFKITVYAYGHAGSMVKTFMQYDSAKMDLYDPVKNAVIADASRGKTAFEGAIYDVNGTPTSIVDGDYGCMEFGARNITDGEGTMKKVDTEIRISAANLGYVGDFGWVDGQFPAETSGLGYKLYSISYKVKDGFTLGDISSTDFPTYVYNTYPTGAAIVDDTGNTDSNNIYYANFPAPAATPTSVTAAAEPAAIVEGASTTITASASVTDGGTLTYALYSNETDSTDGGTLVTDFQSGTTFTVSPTADTYYYVVAKNTKTEDGEESTATAKSSAIKVSVQQKITEPSIGGIAPIAGEAPVTAVTETDAFTGTASWGDSTPATFASDTVYTAHVTLTAKAGYLFPSTGVTPSVAGVAGATFANPSVAENGTTYTVDVTFPATGKTAQKLVDEAKTAVADMTFSYAHADVKTEAAIEAAILADVNAKNLGVSAAVTKVDYTAPADGTDEAPMGTNGSYKFTVTLTAGSKSGTTGELTAEIVATAKSKKAQNEAAVAAAKKAIETKAYAAIAQADGNTAAVLKKYVDDLIKALPALEGVEYKVNGTLTAAKAGTYENRTGTEGSYAFTVELSKGTKADDGGIDTDVKVTATTAEKTVKITPTAFAAKLTQPSKITVDERFEELGVSWTKPQTNGVPVDYYTLTVKEKENGTVVEGYNAKELKSQRADVKGLDNSKTYVIELTAVFVGNLIEANLVKAEGQPFEGDPAPITIKPAQDGEGTEDATLGTVTVTKADGTPVKPSDVKQGFLIKLYAKPAAGKRFVKWVSAENAPATFALDENTGDLTANPLTVQVDKGLTYTPVFADVAKVEAGNPTLLSLSVQAPKDRPLIRQNTTELGYNTFDSKQTEYDLYLLKEESQLQLLPAFNADLYKVEIDGAEYTFTDGVKPDDGDYTLRSDKAVQVKNIGVNQTISIVVTEKNPAEGVEAKKTMYKLHVHKVETDGTNPQMVLELDATQGTRLAMVNVKIAASAFLSGDFSIELKDNVKYTPDGGEEKTIVGFDGFADDQGNVLENGTEYASDETVIRNQSQKSIRVDKFEIADDGKTAKLSLSTADNTPLVVDGDAPIVLKFYVVKSETSNTANDTDAELLKTLSVKTDVGMNVLRDKFFGDLGYWEKTIDGSEPAVEIAAADRVVTLKCAAKYVIVGYVQSARRETDRVFFNVFDMTNNVNIQVNDAPIALGEYGKLQYNTSEGKYRFEIVSPGYLALDLDAGSVSDHLDLDAMTLLAGDLDGSKTIDAFDYDLIVKALGGEVQADSKDDKGNDVLGGYVVVDGESIYADFNDDAFVNALDLGRVIENIALLAQNATPEPAPGA